MMELEDSQEQKYKAKDKASDKNQVTKKTKSKDWNIFCIKQKHLQLCAWLLSTVGLCFIVITLCLITARNSSHTDNSARSVKIVENHAELAVVGNGDDDSVDMEQFILEETTQTFNGSERLGLTNLYDKIQKRFNRCREYSCKITCNNVPDIFTVLNEMIKVTKCSSIDVLLLEQQDFPLGMLKNLWLPSNISFNEVIIRFSGVTVVKSNAFNSHLFKDTVAFSLLGRTIMSVESGALLGLSSLKHLTIRTTLNDFQPAILQPVQRTLLSLKLNGNMQVNGNTNLFDGCYLKKLAYLDLSNNIFHGYLGKNLFGSAPNLKYLIIVQSQLQHIEEDAFEHLAEKLLFVNLSNNRLTTLAGGVFAPVLVGGNKAVINLAENDWICDCQLKAFAQLYKTYSLQFMAVIYCKAPHHLYGASLDELDFGLENSSVPGTIEQSSEEENQLSTVTKVFRDSTEISTTEFNKGIDDNIALFPLKMRCMDNEPADNGQHKLRKVRAASDSNHYMEFPPPNFQFDLKLITENNSAVVYIENPDEDYVVIWFSEELEESVVNYRETNFDYMCMRYASPQLVVGPLQENTTYTFCVLPSARNEISPFNCLPLYVPQRSFQDVWISNDNKHFAIGMLCLMFLLSTIAGAVVAYFGIRAYPDLLEGSKNVSLLKKPDHDYLTTISEIEYQKQSSLKKTKSCTKQHSIKKLPLPATPPLETSAAPYCMSVKDLERMSSVKSSSTCFECRVPSLDFNDDKYETPKIGSDEYTFEQRRVENVYCATPGSPPPLPKRNSNLSHSSTLELNRLSKNRES